MLPLLPINIQKNTAKGDVNRHYQAQLA